MRLGDLWAKHGGGTLWPHSAETKDLFIFGVTDESRDLRYSYRSDGLLVAPFLDEHPFALLIVNNDGSATAIASAARKLGLLDAKTVNVRMPGGVAPVRFDECNGSLERVMLFGEARQANPPV
jgi:hypothetical protein